MQISFFVLVIRIVLAIVLSGLIGAERGIRHKDAGLRTHILIGLGAALIVLTSFFVSDISSIATRVDPTRIIAAVITGIGFLCAGTIIQGGSGVKGLTTAATLWIAAAIGIAVGVGYYRAAIFVALVVFFVLTGLRSIEKSLA